MAIPTLEQKARCQHGTRSRYPSGCRCQPCREANTRSAAGRRLERQAGNANPYISVSGARTHLEVLEGEGMNMRACSEASGIHYSQLYRILRGQQTAIRKQLAQKILVITPPQMSFPRPAQVLPFNPRPA